MTNHRSFLITVLFCLTSFFISAQAQKSKPNIENYIYQRIFNEGKDILELDADEYLGFYRKVLIIRKEDKYMAINFAGRILVPPGKYLFDMSQPKPPIGKAGAINDHFGLIARNPETGLYGMIDQNNPDKEIIPFKYNTLSNFYWYVDAAIGERFDEKGVKKKFFITMDGVEVPYKEGIEFNREQPARYVRMQNYNGPNRLFYDIWEGKVYPQSPNVHQYYGFNLYRTDSSFNDLNKFGFVNHQGKMIVPYQINYNYRIAPFQYAGAGSSKAVSILQGYSDAHYKYALMDTLGNIYAKVREGEIFSNINIPETEIIHGYIHVTASKQKGQQSTHYLWDVLDDKFIDMQELFSGNYGDILKLVKDGSRYSFTYLDRNEHGILFRFSAALLPIKEVPYLFPDAKPYISGGFNGGKLISYDVYGYGFMDYTGKITVPPVFSRLDLPDGPSGMAYAELNYNNKKHKGFIHATTGQFEFLFK